MKKDELPADGTNVLFRSDSDNPNRRSLNDSVCTIVSRKELRPDSPAYHGYTQHVAVEIRFPYSVDDPRHNGGITWTDLSELHLIDG
jgi:hypothetical protein